VGTILTIGYEGAAIEDFIATLMTANVQVLMDIRDVPVSRKRGFSKKSLALAVENAGLEYVHLQGLGDPKPGRDAARRGDMETFERIFRAHMSCDDSQEALAQAVEIASRSRACLLCFERNHACCHRSIVAEAMADCESLNVRHLGVRHGLAKERNYSGVGSAYAVG
jgi:uncharacterized protein (DUF488 family)